ncbi:hypothetical protein ACFQ61_24780 [Streptomyces sp. NPDC056500]|uniref:hypothetical protein n=1 Tax=Streptomyces sp. NPDC056500 TaxID=3345840 RepID=UPI0036987B64
MRPINASTLDSAPLDIQPPAPRRPGSPRRAAITHRDLAAGFWPQDEGAQTAESRTHSPGADAAITTGEIEAAEA